MFALLDCNNFYVSCERLFRPELAGRPVVVLSNNDGCIIARSNEAKSLGIRMGEPYFRTKPLIKKCDVRVFSSNYPLYGDLSQRVMDVLRQLESEVEVYSIDEAFIRLPDRDIDALLDNGHHIRARIGRQVGVPVSIGFGPTKTLAKIANRIAKKNGRHEGVFLILPDRDIDALLAGIDVGDIWGIGPRYAAKLKANGMHNSLQLRNADNGWLRKHLTISGLRTAMELRGISCFSLEDEPQARKSIASSRSFSRPVTGFQELREALASYVSIAAEKLRAKHLKAGCLLVYLMTNSFREGEPQYSNSKTIVLRGMTAYTPELVRQACNGLQRIYRTGYAYQKTGVVLMDLVPERYEQAGLFDPPCKDRGSLMAALDRINSRWGRDTLQCASAGFSRPWWNKQAQKSPAYTTNWQELPVVRA